MQRDVLSAQRRARRGLEDCGKPHGPPSFDKARSVSAWSDHGRDDTEEEPDEEEVHQGSLLPFWGASGAVFFGAGYTSPRASFFRADGSPTKSKQLLRFLSPGGIQSNSVTLFPVNWTTAKLISECSGNALYAAVESGVLASLEYTSKTSSLWAIAAAHVLKSESISASLV